MKKGRIQVPLLLGVLFIVDVGVGVIAYDIVGQLVGLAIVSATVAALVTLGYFSFKRGRVDVRESP